MTMRETDELHHRRADAARAPLGSNDRKIEFSRSNAMTNRGGLSAIVIVVATGSFHASAQQTPTLQSLTPAQTEMVRPLLQQGFPTSGGEIRGFVAAAPPGGLDLPEAALPHAQVFVQTADGGIEQQSLTQTDSQGHFPIASRTPGTYHVSAARQGFATGCSAIQVVNHNVALPQPIALKPISATIT